MVKETVLPEQNVSVPDAVIVGLMIGKTLITVAVLIAEQPFA